MIQLLWIQKKTSEIPKEESLRTSGAPKNEYFWVLPDPQFTELLRDIINIRNSTIIINSVNTQQFFHRNIGKHIISSDRINIIFYQKKPQQQLPCPTRPCATPILISTILYLLKRKGSLQNYGRSNKTDRTQITLLCCNNRLLSFILTLKVDKRKTMNKI